MLQLFPGDLPERLRNSKLGLVFADPQEVTHRVITSSARQGRLEIPPHANNHREEATWPATPVDLFLLSMMPHTHPWGKTFRYEARCPDGLLQRVEATQKYRHLFEKFDQDGSGTVSPDEFSAGLARPASERREGAS